jgi:uncharacterized protein YciI
MWYMILGADAPDSLPRRQLARADHLQRLAQLRDAGRLLIAGPLPAIDSADPGPNGFTGSLVVAEFDSLQAARDWANADPYAHSGVFAHVDVRPWLQVLP